MGGPGSSGAIADHGWEFGKESADSLSNVEQRDGKGRTLCFFGGSVQQV
jgi:hypothetical protein